MSVLKRLSALVLSLCLLMAAFSQALAEESAGDEVTRSDFSFSLLLHADGFPNDGAAHYADWETFLSKLSLEGVVDVQRFLTNISRVYFDGGLCVNGEMALPFVYDGYHSYRYVRADALRGDSIHFQMHNFFEFMLKGYYFMGLPTQLIALPLYPEASYYLGTSYYQPIAEAVAGEGDRTVSHADLYELCETLDLIVNDDWDYERAYFYFTSMLIDLGASDMVLQKLGYLEDWLLFMDPEEEGLFITDDGVSQTYTLGGTQVFTHTKDASGERFSLCLPDPDGYELTVSYENTGAEIHGSLRITLEGAERLTLNVDVDGLPTGGALAAQGTATIAFGGECFSEPPAPVSFAYRYSRDAAELPYAMTLDVDWLHPETGKPALTFAYQAAMKQLPDSAMVERVYDNQNDFFHLNESFMEEYKQLYLPTLALSAVPVLVEMPAGVISDIMGFLYETGFLAFLGLE